MDARAIAQVQVDSYLSAYRDLLPGEYLANFTYGEQEKDWMGWQTEHPQDILLVAEEGGVVIGYALSREVPEESGWGEVAALHGGTARLANHPDGGAVATLTLPRARVA